MAALLGVADLSSLAAFQENTALSKAPGERLCYNALHIFSLYKVELSEFTERKKVQNASGK